MKTLSIEKKKGVSLVSRAAAEARRQYFLQQKSYWEHLEQKKGQHWVVKNSLLNLQELNKEFLILPLALEKFFLLYLDKHHPSQQNKQRAVNIARVYALLSHQYFQSAEKYNMVASFFVSPSIWDKWLIGRKAKESSIKTLQEMDVIFSYRFNLEKHHNKPRFVTMYQFKIAKVKWLHACAKTLLALQENRQDGDSQYNYDDIMEDIFGYIAQTENDL